MDEGKSTTRVHCLLLLLCCCWTLMAIAVNAENFPVCSKCNCALLPTTLDGRVVDVPAPTTGGNDWFVFNESIRSNATVVLLFRSIDPACKVEIKLKSINSTVQFLVYPGGRIDPTTANFDLAPADWFCGNSWSGSPLFLGTSVTSTTQELAIAFINLGRVSGVVVDLQLVHRQYCPSMKSQAGFPLALPPVSGTATQKLQVGNLYRCGGVYGLSRIFVSWSIAASTTICSTEIKFTNSTNNTKIALNELSPALLGITHRVPRGIEATIQVGEAYAFSNHIGDAAVTVEYRSVDCGPSPINGTAIQIASWNNIVKPLKRMDVPAGQDPWQVINFTFPDDGAQQVAIWYLAGPEPEFTALISWKYIDVWAYLPQLYQGDFDRRFNASILNGTKPFIYISAALTKTMASFGYGFYSIATAPLLVATARNTTYNNIVITPDMVTARRIYIQAANESCVIETHPIRSVWLNPDIRAFPFGFGDSSLSDILATVYSTSPLSDDGSGGIGIAISYGPIRSIGPIMGIQFLARIDPVREPHTFLYRMVCPTRLDTTTPPHGTWRYAFASAGRSFLLQPPPPRSDGNNCRLHVSGTSSILPRDGSLFVLVTCLQAPRHAKLLKDREAVTSTDINCTNNAVYVDVYGVSFSNAPKNATLFAYRVTCDNDTGSEADGGLAPLLPLSRKFVAKAKWQTLDTEEYEYEESPYGGGGTTRLRHVWMIQATSPNCRIEIHVDETSDLSSMKIAEDYMDDFRGIRHPVSGVQVRNLHYLSCGPRVFVSGLDLAMSRKHKFQYRQFCVKDASSPSCSQNVTVEPSLSNSEWQILEVFSPGTLNQLLQIHYHIPFLESHGNNGSQTAMSKVLELEFTSLVTAESWSGIWQAYRYSSPWAETHGVWLNDKIRAIVGKQYLFKNSVSIRLDSLLRTKQGDHLFTVRYRMVDAKQARQEIRLGEVLMATSKPKTLKFKIPQQFSANELQQIIKRKQFALDNEDAYAVHMAGDFPVWLFRHQYTIWPSNASCQVALKFETMDIGSGYLLGSSKQYSNQQRRLSVMTNSNGSRRIPVDCSSIMDDVRTRRTQNLSGTTSLCARLDRTYVSAPRSALALLFRSTDATEYEYEFSSETIYGPSYTGLAITGVGGPEVTFGTGWTATFQQVCDPAKIQSHADMSLTPVKAKPVRNHRDWQRNLPGQLQSNDYRLFRDKRWIVTPQQAGCLVEYQVQYVKRTKKKPKEPIPVLFQVGNNVTLARPRQTFASVNVTVIQLGTSKANPIVINYRQVCTRIPTASPTIPATPAPTVPFHSKVDSETCTYDRECASGICSKTLQRCTTKACASQCASKGNSQALCQAYSLVGCSCQWSSQGNSCVMVA